MAETATRAIIGGLGVAIGLAAGLSLAWMMPSETVSPRLERAPTTEVDSPTDTEPARPTAMVCASSSGGAEALWARWCEAQLAEHDRRAEMVRLDWPRTLGAEAPAAWVDAVERAVEACDLPLELQTIECTEYPCMATFAPDQGADVEAALAKCPALQEAFPDFTIGSDTTRVRCPDGSLEDVDVLFAYAVPTLRELVAPHVGPGKDDFFETIRVLSRRLDDVASTHGCGE